MNLTLRVQTLVLNCRKSRETTPFSERITAIHGQIAAGKSSIVRLIDFCLGGKIEETPAIRQELVSVELTARVGDFDVLFEREARGSHQVQVTWHTAAGEGASVLAPLQDQGAPIWGDSIFNLSDLLFSFFGIAAPVVRKGKADPDSPLVRLSFRDIMWYCYLQQDLLDSSFYRLEDPYLRLKSRDVMRFIVGYYSERLRALEILLEETVNERTAKLATAAQIEQFLREFGHESTASLQAAIESCSSELEQAKTEIQHLREGQLPQRHLTDSLREDLRRLSGELAKEEAAESDLKERIGEDDALRAELLSAKVKLTRADVATAVLGGVNFERCPACGTELGQIEGRGPGVCKLCGQHPRPQPADAGRRSDVINRDLTSRIEELDEALRQHRAGLRRQTQRIARLRDRKQQLDRRLTEEMRQYDSILLAGLRDLERRSATLEERAHHLQRIKEMVGSVERLRQEANALQGIIESLRREIHAEKGTLTNADQCITELERAYHEALMKVGVPGVHAEDEVHVDRTSWKVYIWPHGDEALRWDFSNAGSGGKKTLLNVCYALALHRVASAKNLPLPRFLIIDTPMKNIGEDVNQDLFVRFYRYLYELASTSLGDTQFIIVDKEFIEPAGYSVDVIHRFMTPHDKDHPPLINYYRGA